MSSLQTSRSSGAIPQCRVEEKVVCGPAFGRPTHHTPPPLARTTVVTWGFHAESLMPRSNRGTADHDNGQVTDIVPSVKKGKAGSILDHGIDVTISQKAAAIELSQFDDYADVAYHSAGHLHDPGRSLDPAVVDVRRVPAHPITDNR